MKTRIWTISSPGSGEIRYILPGLSPHIIELPSGKKVDGQAGGFIGINGTSEISSGHDSTIDGAYATCPACYEGIEELWEEWSTEDKLALAEIMLKRWEDYRQAVIEKTAERAK